MRSKILLVILGILLTAGATGCQVIGDIFQAGVWVGIILVILVIAFIVFIITKVRK